MRFIKKMFALSFLLWVACSDLDSIEMPQKTFTFLALGDSYTIGEAVEVEERWPMQLTARLNSNKLNVEEPRIIATTGWTTDELQNGIELAEIEETYSLVSLLIGVNNQYRGYPLDQYEREFEELLDQAIAFADGQNENVFIISIPDYGVTPFAEKLNLDPNRIARELDEYNAIAKRIADSKNVSFTNITEESRKARYNITLIASDGLHPSSIMYAQWVDQ